jgi:hypothetical protein
MHTYHSLKTKDGDVRDMSIHANLHHALMHLRPSPGQSPRKVWAEAICINQQDDGERSAQVARMGEIYNAADRVIVWLGTSDPSRKKLLDLIFCLERELETAKEKHQSGVRQHPDTWISIENCIVSRVIDMYPGHPSSLVGFLRDWQKCSFDWFRRTWVL